MSTPKPPRKASGKKTASTRRTFDPDFKREAVHLGREVGFARAAEQMDVNECNLRNWDKAIRSRGNEAFAPLSERTDVEAELQKLKAELKQVKMERDILKKATAFFAKDHG